MKSKQVKDIDSYIEMYTDNVKDLLEEIRSIIQNAAPKATEVISYNMPAFKQRKVLVYFAANKNHIGFYPTGSGIKAFEKDLSQFEYSKGTIKFPLDKKLPKGLIQKIVKFRVRMDSEGAKLKIKKK